MAPSMLLALDVDGTLLTREGEVASEDRRAIHRAREAGIAVTLASGRLPTGLYRLAEELGLVHPLIAADGGLVVGARSKRLLRRHVIPAADVTALIGTLREQNLAVFCVTAHAMVARPEDHERFPFVSSWAPVRAQDPLTAPVETLYMVGLGESLGVDEGLSTVRVQPGVVGARFDLQPDGPAGLRVAPRGVDKATALGIVARRFRLGPGRVACVGDWWNDVGMMRWCQHSFAMAGAPAMVRDAARFQLRSVGGEGGGVAEAVEHLLAWLADVPTRTHRAPSPEPVG